MKKSGLIVLLGFLFAIPVVGYAQVGTTSINGGGTSVSTASTCSIPTSILHQVLTIAAPIYGYAGQDFIDLYYSCGCVEVEQIGPNTYRVNYGGLGVIIIIDGSRTSGPCSSTLPVGTKR